MDGARGHRRARTAYGAIGAVAVLALAGCGHEQPGEPSFQSGAMTGLNSRVGPILLRDVYVEEPKSGAIPKGGTARVYLHLYNTGQQPDALVGASTPAARSVTIQRDADKDGTYTTVSSIALPAGVPNRQPTDPAAGKLEPAYYYLQLTGLTSDLRSGENITVTFRFRRAGTKTMPVPVELPRVSSREPGVSPSG